MLKHILEKYKKMRIAVKYWLLGRSYLKAAEVKAV